MAGTSQATEEIFIYAQTGYDQWSVDWRPGHTTREECHRAMEFEIADRECTLFVDYVYSIHSMKLKFDYIKGKGDDQPLRVEVSYNGKTEKMEKVEPTSWVKSWDLTECYIVHLELVLQFPSKENHLLRRMSNLLKTREMADVTFIVKGQEIRAHHLIVTSASSVIAAMLEPEKFKEGTSKTVVIDDEEPEVFNQLLQYIYTGTFQVKENESIPELLFLAADKYLLHGLKNACERTIISKLSLENVFYFLVIAHLYSAPNLLDASLEFLVVRKNEVQELPEWKELEEKYHNLYSMATERFSGKHLYRNQEAYVTVGCRQTSEDDSEEESGCSCGNCHTYDMCSDYSDYFNYNSFFSSVYPNYDSFDSDLDYEYPC